MNYLDIALAIVLVFSFLVGFSRGLIVGAFSLAGMILGVVLASRFYTAFSDSTIVQVVTFALIFIVVASLVSFSGSVVKKVAHLVMLGWLDRILGAVVGVAIGGIAIALALVTYLHFIGPSSLITESVISQVLVDRLPLVLGLLPDRFGETIRPFFY